MYKKRDNVPIKMTYIIHWTTLISPAYRAEDWHYVLNGNNAIDSHRSQSLSFLHSALTLSPPFFSYCKHTLMVSLGFISTYKNLTRVKTRQLNEPVILLLGMLLGINSQETHICMHKETNKNVPWNTIWKKNNKMETIEMFISSRMENKIWHSN